MKRMNVTEASQKYAGCELKSELARLCLPAAQYDPNRKLAWVNSICILFLLIGIVGAKSSTTRIKRPPPIEEVVPIVIEAPPPPPTKIEAQQTPEPTEQPKQDAPAVVVVTPESPAINFSIPTIGHLVVPNAIATAPPANPLKPVTPVRNEPRTITNTGQGGDRPTPDYPKLAKDLHQEGTVVLILTANESGIITNIQISQSSGSSILDHSALEYVKRHWILPSGTATQLYEAPIRYTFTQ
jgi:TonB family protein